MEVQAELTAITIIVLAALLCGMLCTRFNMPAVVGYIVAGVALGPSGAGLVDDRGQIGVVAELGVLLLLFTIGMQLSLRGFRAIWLVAVGTALLQIAAAVGVMLLLGTALGFSFGASVLLGFVVALSSTVVAVRMLEGLNILRQVGQITVSILIAQDLAIVPMILVLQSMAGGALDFIGILRVIIAAAALAALILYLSRRHRIRLPLSGLLAQQVDLRPIYGVALRFGAAAVSGFLEITSAYGAFIAGLVVGNSTARNVMLRSIGPIQNLLMMAVFLSIGLLVDLGFIWQNIGAVVTIVLVITVAKTLFNIGVIRLLGEPWPHAFIAGLLIAQIGEFSFLIGENRFRCRADHRRRKEPDCRRDRGDPAHQPAVAGDGAARRADGVFQYPELARMAGAAARRRRQRLCHRHAEGTAERARGALAGRAPIWAAASSPKRRRRRK